MKPIIVLVRLDKKELVQITGISSITSVSVLTQTSASDESLNRCLQAFQKCELWHLGFIRKAELNKLTILSLAVAVL